MLHVHPLLNMHFGCLKNEKFIEYRNLSFYAQSRKEPEILGSYALGIELEIKFDLYVSLIIQKTDLSSLLAKFKVNLWLVTLIEL